MALCNGQVHECHTTVCRGLPYQIISLHKKKEFGHGHEVVSKPLFAYCPHRGPGKWFGSARPLLFIPTQPTIDSEAYKATDPTNHNYIVFHSREVVLKWVDILRSISTSNLCGIVCIQSVVPHKGVRKYLIMQQFSLVQLKQYSMQTVCGLSKISCISDIGGRCVLCIGVLCTQILDITR